MNINTTCVQIPNHDLLIDAYLAQPAEANFGAAIVF